MMIPPRNSRSTNKVRGTVSLGGVEVSRWDSTLLKKRIGLVLNDVRTITDTAEFLSGLTIEEILDPMDGPLQTSSPGSREHHAMNTALQMVGLSSSLLPRLTTKLATVVTANEAELAPSPLRPRCYALSPAEWSKLLLARVLTQALYDHGSQSSLQGTVLLLDDTTIFMSEVEEARLLRTLKRSGAATVMTSHKWASGRWADQIVVVKDGAIVERGTHEDLLRLGPQQSFYAAKWQTMLTDN
mmetsp:Transcript_5349/g.9282  ORF Transcript_5349/g.9282 Transcript_5349/m.9282 type:complete len:242 (-) Transcript_5349:24-749(-)